MPTRWDETQVGKITDVHQEIQALNCSSDLTAPLNTIGDDLQWLHQYNLYTGAKDIDAMVTIEEKTVNEFQDNVAAKKSNAVYCQLKKALLLQQTDIIGHTIKGSLQ
ncbi:MAG: hypothetical protein KGI25_08925 [Thaumarchaeota archaeon]|nr:hypothetical protein [Nitrososphaerota archaeon]